MAATLLWLEDRHFARGGKPRLTYTGWAYSSIWPDSPGAKVKKSGMGSSQLPFCIRPLLQLCDVLSSYLHTAFLLLPTQFLLPLPIDHLAFCRPSLKRELSTIMGILSTRISSSKHPDQVKSETSVANHEIDLSANGGTQDQDGADMAKLGFRQQTKVSRWMYLSIQTLH